MSTETGGRGMRGTKEQRKIFQTKEGKNISFNFYLQVLVLFITDTQIQLYKY